MLRVERLKNQRIYALVAVLGALLAALICVPLVNATWGFFLPLEILYPDVPFLALTYSVSAFVSATVFWPADRPKTKSQMTQSAILTVISTFFISVAVIIFKEGGYTFIDGIIACIIFVLGGMCATLGIPFFIGVTLSRFFIEETEQEVI